MCNSISTINGFLAFERRQSGATASGVIHNDQSRYNKSHRANSWKSARLWLQCANLCSVEVSLVFMWPELFGGACTVKEKATFERSSRRALCWLKQRCLSDLAVCQTACYSTVQYVTYNSAIHACRSSLPLPHSFPVFTLPFNKLSLRRCLQPEWIVCLSNNPPSLLLPIASLRRRRTSLNKSPPDPSRLLFPFLLLHSCLISSLQWTRLLCFCNSQFDFYLIEDLINFSSG